MTGWRRREAVQEGLRSLAASGAVGAALVAVVAAGLAVPAVLDATQVSTLVTEEAAWIDSGGTVLIASADGTQLDARQCEAVAAMTGVEAAFGVTRHPGGAGTAAAPDARVAVASATSGMYGFLHGQAGGALIASRVQQDIGSGPALTLLPPVTAQVDPSAPSAAGPASPGGPAGTVRISDRVDTGVLGDEYAYVVLVPQRTAGTVDRCYVRARPADLDTIRAALPAVLATPDEPVVVADRLVGGRFSRDYSQEFDERTTRLLPPLGGVVVAVMWLVVSWYRRGEDGLYRTLGATATDRLTMRGCEWLAVLGLGAVAAWAATLLYLVVVDRADPVALRAAATSTAIGAASAVLTSLAWFALPRRDTLADLKDR